MSSIETAVLAPALRRLHHLPDEELRATLERLCLDVLGRTSH